MPTTSMLRTRKPAAPIASPIATPSICGSCIASTPAITPAASSSPAAQLPTRFSVAVGTGIVASACETEDCRFTVGRGAGARARVTTGRLRVGGGAASDLGGTAHNASSTIR
jgi:hypothetical protein